MAPMTFTNHTENRRPLKTRQQAWAHKLAHFFVRLGVSPNQMSLASIGCAIIGAGSLLWSSVTESPLRSISLIGAATFIQLRLLANMLDGLMAVEEGKKTPTGILYNELLDRPADILLLVAAGYATAWAELGWIAAVLAVSTAYIRALGGALGYAQDYRGPMAKPHRMFALTIGSLMAALLPRQPVLAIALGVIVLGSVITLLRRISRLARNLSGQHHD
jgi:phosphatidylglycerophosphate synthase